MNFISDRLGFRFFTKEDFDLFFSVFSNEDVMRYAWIDKISDKDECRAFFEDFINDGDMPSKNNSYTFAVFLREDEEFIGFADIQIHSRNRFGGCGEIGYFLLPDFWGRGYATELANTLVDVGFTNLDLHKMCARCNANNLKSEEIMKKIGMTKEGALRKVRLKNGIWDDEKHYGILIDEWRNKKQGGLNGFNYDCDSN